MHGVGSPERLRRIFLAIGLIPGLYGMRRLPLGVWLYIGAWAGIAAAILLLAGITIKAWRRGLLRTAAGLTAVAVVALVVANLSGADARESLGVSTRTVTLVAVAVQAVVAVIAVRAHASDRRRAPLIAYGSVVATALMLSITGDRLPSVVLVAVIAVVAARFTLLPLRTSAGGTVAWTDAVFFGWTAVTLIVETGTLHRTYGVAIGAFALLVGGAVLVAAGDGAVAGRLVKPAVVVAAGVPMLVLLFVLVPSVESMQWLMARGFSAPSRFELRAERLSATRYERWYDTRQHADAALVDAHLGLGQFVSEWTGTLGNDIDGHLFGYRLDIRVWERLSQAADRPDASRCRYETRSCVLIVLRRSDNRDSNEPSGPLRLPRVDPRELSPRSR